MKLKKPLMTSSEILEAQAIHFIHSMSDVHSQEELTPDEKGMVSPEVFDLLLEPSTVNDKNMDEELLLLMEIGDCLNFHLWKRQVKNIVDDRLKAVYKSHKETS